MSHCGKTRALFAKSVIALVSSGSLGIVTPVFAQSSEAVRTEARERFDRGLRLFNQGDASGALAEFSVAYERSPHPLVLFNIALVYEALGKPVQAVDAAERLLAEPSGLSPDRVGRLRSLRAEQALRIGSLEITVNVPGATLEVDGEAAGTAPLASPLRVSTGAHLVTVIARDHAPARRTVLVASGARHTENVTLEPLSGALGQLRVKSSVPDAQVFVDGQPAGTTPLAASLALAPGTHQIELRRAGYATAAQAVAVGQGSSGDITLEPVASPELLTTEGGSLALRLSEEESVVFVDGTPRGGYAKPLRLPAGRHRLRVERAGFFPFERDVFVNKGTPGEVTVELQPTPEFRADYVSSARTRRTIGYVTGGAGALFTLGGAGFLVWNAGQKSEKEDAFDELLFESEPGSGRRCDPMGTAELSCAKERELALEELDEARSRDVYGWVGLGVGVAALGAGAVLVLTGDDPDRYEPRPESDVFGRLEVVPFGGPGATGLRLRGAF